MRRERIDVAGVVGHPGCAGPAAVQHELGVSATGFRQRRSVSPGQRRWCARSCLSWSCGGLSSKSWRGAGKIAGSDRRRRQENCCPIWPRRPSIRRAESTTKRSVRATTVRRASVVDPDHADAAPPPGGHRSVIRQDAAAIHRPARKIVETDPSAHQASVTQGCGICQPRARVPAVARKPCRVPGIGNPNVNLCQAVIQ